MIEQGDRITSKEPRSKKWMSRDSLDLSSTGIANTSTTLSTSFQGKVRSIGGYEFVKNNSPVINLGLIANSCLPGVHMREVA